MVGCSAGLRWVVLGGECRVCVVGGGGWGWDGGCMALMVQGGGVGVGFGAAIWGARYSVARVAPGWGWVRDTPAGPVTRA